MKIDIVSVQDSPLAVSEHATAESVHVAELAAELGRQGHRVTVHTRKDRADLGDKVTLAPGVTVEHLAAGPERPLTTDELLPHLGSFADRLNLRWSEQRPDVAHAHGWTSGLVALSGRGEQRVPVVQTYLENAKLKVECALGRTVDAIAAGSLQEREDLVRKGLPRPRISVVPAGIDVDTFTDRGPSYPRGDRPRLLMLSGPAEPTGCLTAVKALPRVPGAELVIAGGPGTEDLEVDPDANRVRLLAKDMGVDNRVILLGRVARRNIPALLRSADLVLTLRENEPFGLVPLEAMACGVPVLATRSGANLDTVLDNVTGVLVSPRVRPGELARELRTLLGDRTRLSALGIGGTDRARSRHAWERVAKETTAVYEKALH